MTGYLSDVGAWLVNWRLLTTLVILASQIGVLTAVAVGLLRFGLYRQPHWAARIWLLTVVCMLALPLAHFLGGWQLHVSLASHDELADSPTARMGEPRDASGNAMPETRALVDDLGQAHRGLSQGFVESRHARGELDETGDGPIPASHGNQASEMVALADADASVDRADLVPSNTNSKTLDDVASDFAMWPIGLAAVYAAISLLLLVRLAFATRRLQAFVRVARPVDPHLLPVVGQAAAKLGLKRVPEVMCSKHVKLPLAFGLRRPVVLVPQGFDVWPSEEQQSVIWHELAHVARRDLLPELLARLLTILYWIHPAVWFTARRLRQSLELAADRRVLDCGAPARQYANSLLAVLERVGGEREHSRFPAVAMSAIGNVEERLRNILRAPVAASLRRGPCFAGLLIAAAAFTTVRLQRLVAEPVQPPVQAELSTPSATKPPAKPAEAQAVSTTDDDAVDDAVDDADNSLHHRLANCDVLNIVGEEYDAIFHVDGQVLAEDGRPVAGAIVVLRESASARLSMMTREDRSLRRSEAFQFLRIPDVFARTTTDAEGRFQFDGVKSPALHADWKNSWSGSIVAGHESFGVGWSVLGPKKERERFDQNLTLILKPSSDISGRYQTPDGDPIAGAAVMLSSVEPPQRSFGFGSGALELYSQLRPVDTTDAEGRFSFHGLPAGMAATVATGRHAGWLGSFAAVATSAEVPLIERDRHYLPVLKQIQASPVTLTGDSGLRIHGRIVDESRDAVAGAIVTFANSVYEAVSDVDGLFTIDEPRTRVDQVLDANEEARLLVRTEPGSGFLPQFVPVSSDKLHDAAVEVSVTLRRGVRITGTVVDDAGQPVEKCRVSQFKDVRELPASGITDSDGKFELLLPPGEHQLLFATDQPGFQLPSERDARFAKPESVADWLTRTVHAVEGETIKLEPVVVQRSSELQVIVSLPNGRPALGATVSLYDTESYTVGSSTRSFERRNAISETQRANALGRVSVVPQGQPSRLAVAEASLNARETGYFGSASLSDIANNTLHIVLQENALIQGRVLRDGQAWPGVVLSIGESKPVLGADGSRTGGSTVTNHREVTTNSEGIYRAAVPAGRSYSIFVRSFPDGSQPPNFGRIAQVTGNGKYIVDEIDIITATQEIAGVVVDAKGTPIVDANVRISSSQSHLWHGHQESSQFRTDGDGRFHLRSIPPGKHDLWIRGPRSEGREASNTRLTAEAGATNLRIMLEGRPKPELPRLQPKEIRDL